MNKIRGLQIKKLVTEADKLINFIDVAGDGQYFRTISKGLNNHPDYIFIVFDATKKELDPVGVNHAQLAFHFDKPIVFLITKIDAASPN